MNWFNNRGNMLWKIVLIIFGAFFGIASYLLYQDFVTSTAVIPVSANILLLILIYVYLRTHYRRIRNTGIDAVVRDIDAIQANQKVPAGEPVQEFLKVHAAIEELSKNIRAKEQIRSEIINMVNSVASNMELEKLLAALMPKLLEASLSNWGAFYLANHATNKLEVKSSIGFSKNLYNEFDINIGEGFIGQAALTREPKIIRDIPEDTVFITRTFLGKIKPKNIMVVPIVSQEQLIGVLTLASLYEYTGEQTEIVDMIKYYIGAAIENSVIYERSKRLANELQFQNKLIHDLNVELETKIRDEIIFTDVFINKIETFAIYFLDKDLNISLWNKGAEILFGYTANEVIGRSILTVYDYFDNFEDYLQKKADRRSSASQSSDRVWKRKKDGTMFFSEFTVFGRYDNHGELAGYTNIVKDITELKTIQEILSYEKTLNRKLMDLSDNALISIDENGIVRYASKTAAELIYKGNGAGIDIDSGTFTMEGTDFYTLFEGYDKIKEYIASCTAGSYQGFTSVYNKNIVNIGTAEIGNGTENVKDILIVLKA